MLVPMWRPVDLASPTTRQPEGGSRRNRCVQRPALRPGVP